MKNKIMKMFLVEYWIPFPQSEYGGLVCIIGKDKKEVFKIIKAGLDTEKYDIEIKTSIHEALIYELNPEIDYVSGIVKSFVT